MISITMTNQLPVTNKLRIGMWITIKSCLTNIFGQVHNLQLVTWTFRQVPPSLKQTDVTSTEGRVICKDKTTRQTLTNSRKVLKASPPRFASHCGRCTWYKTAIGTIKHMHIFDHIYIHKCMCIYTPKDQMHPTRKMLTRIAWQSDANGTNALVRGQLHQPS